IISFCNSTFPAFYTDDRSFRATWTLRTPTRAPSRSPSCLRSPSSRSSFARGPWPSRSFLTAFRLCCTNSRGSTMSVKPPFLLSLGGHSKQAGDERDLTQDVPLFDASYLPFPDHVHDPVSLQRVPCRFRGEEASPRFHPSCGRGGRQRGTFALFCRPLPPTGCATRSPSCKNQPQQRGCSQR